MKSDSKLTSINGTMHVVGSESKMLEVGSKDVTAVKKLQHILSELGYGKFDMTGVFGEKTKASVIAFQKANNLKPDGIVGELTVRVLKNGLPKPEVVTSDNLSLLALQIAKTQLHVREKTGKNDGEAVESYLKSVALGKGYAWCAAFVYWCFSEAAKQLDVPNPLYKTAGVLHHWNNTKGLKTKTNPQAGDIFIMDYGKGNGHTGIVERVVGDIVHTIEGNTNSASSREGDGVYLRARKMNTIVGYIRYS